MHRKVHGAAREQTIDLRQVKRMEADPASGGTVITLRRLAIPAGVALHRYVVPVMAQAAQAGVPPTLLSVYPAWELALLGASGLLIAVAGALGPATWVARVRTTTALRAD